MMADRASRDRSTMLWPAAVRGSSKDGSASGTDTATPSLPESSSSLAETPEA